jgi:hypothetical protein
LIKKIPCPRTLNTIFSTYFELHNSKNSNDYNYFSQGSGVKKREVLAVMNAEEFRTGAVQKNGCM